MDFELNFLDLTTYHLDLFIPLQLNAPALSSTTNDEMRGWASTAQQLGKIVKHFIQGKSVEVSLQTQGEE